MDSRLKMPYDEVLKSTLAAQYAWVEERKNNHKEITVALNLIYYSAWSNQLPAIRTMNLKAMCAEWESWVVMSGNLIEVSAGPVGISFVVRFNGRHFCWTIPTRRPDDFKADEFSLVLPLYEALFGQTLKMLYAPFGRPYPLLCPRTLDEILDYFDFNPDVLVHPHNVFCERLFFLPPIRTNGLVFMVKAFGGQVTYDRDDDQITDEFVGSSTSFAYIIPQGGRKYISMRQLSFSVYPFVYESTLSVNADEFPLDIPDVDAAVVVADADG